MLECILAEAHGGKGDRVTAGGRLFGRTLRLCAARAIIPQALLPAPVTAGKACLAQHVPAYVHQPRVMELGTHTAQLRG